MTPELLEALRILCDVHTRRDNDFDLYVSMGIIPSTAGADWNAYVNAWRTVRNEMEKHREELSRSGEAVSRPLGHGAADRGVVPIRLVSMPRSRFGNDGAAGKSVAVNRPIRSRPVYIRFRFGWPNLGNIQALSRRITGYEPFWGLMHIAAFCLAVWAIIWWLVVQ
jgi:hypothetical protein